MAEFDADKNQLQIKLVYYGPALSGKTTNLASLHETLNPDLKGDMMVLETKNDRTLFFDLFPLGFEAPSGLLVKVKLYTVPGQVQHDSTRKAVLSRADGVVFVADSQVSQSENNLEAFSNLAENANRVGLNFEQLPLVVQFNKRDLRQIVSEEELQERWEPSPWWPIQLSAAVSGHGVEETLACLLGRVYGVLDQEYALQQTHELPESSFVDQALGR